MAKRDTSEQVRRFGPMTGLLVAAAIAFIVLPSTLTLPNPSPTSQEEIAPVPPSDAQITAPSNFTSLSAGTQGNGLGDGGGGGNLPATLPPPPLVGKGNVPDSTYACVAGRQTEDPLSPTCVPFYIGENGGETYQGVSAKEVKVLLYFEPLTTLQTSQGTSTPPYDTIVDVDAPPKPREHPTISTVRAWEQFFYKRYAGYNRKVHLFVQFGTLDSAGKSSPGTQAQDAAKAYATTHPFAVINYVGFGNGDYYNNYMAEHGVLIFGSIAVRSAGFYKQYAGKQWGYKPPFEYSAAQYAQFACNSLQGKPTADVGSGQLDIANGQPRKFGLLYTTDKGFPGIQDQALVARDLMKKQCGIDAFEQHYAVNGYSIDNGTTPDYAITIAQQFQSHGVTTVLWPAGYEAKISTAMNNIHYYPEIITGDDDQQASVQGANFQDYTVWDHAWNMTSRTYVAQPNDRICAQEYRSVDQNSPESDVQKFACSYYEDLRQVYTGIQVAGPNLTPTSLDQGFHAIPIVESTNPQVPTCYYLASDYTCVKDSTIMHYDPAGQSWNSDQPGCWRMSLGGKRYLPGKFPKLNLDAMNNDAKDFCNNFRSLANLQLA